MIPCFKRCCLCLAVSIDSLHVCSGGAPTKNGLSADGYAIPPNGVSGVFLNATTGLELNTQIEQRQIVEPLQMHLTFGTVYCPATVQWCPVFGVTLSVFRVSRSSVYSWCLLNTAYKISFNFILSCGLHRWNIDCFELLDTVASTPHTLCAPILWRSRIAPCMPRARNYAQFNRIICLCCCDRCSVQKSSVELRFWIGIFIKSYHIVRCAQTAPFFLSLELHSSIIALIECNRKRSLHNAQFFYATIFMKLGTVKSSCLVIIQPFYKRVLSILLWYRDVNLHLWQRWVTFSVRRQNIWFTIRWRAHI